MSAQLYLHSSLSSRPIEASEFARSHGLRAYFTHDLKRVELMPVRPFVEDDDFIGVPKWEQDPKGAA